MNIERLKQKKYEKGYSVAQIAELAGLPVGTVQKIFNGETKHPRYKTIQALESVLGSLSGEEVSSDAAAPAASAAPAVEDGIPARRERSMPSARNVPGYAAEGTTIGADTYMNKNGRYPEAVREAASAYGNYAVREAAPAYGNSPVREAAPAYGNSAAAASTSTYGNSAVREAAPAYGNTAEEGIPQDALSVLGSKKQGEYTIEDYFALPDDQRVELIDGVIYDMVAPTLLHQVLGGEVFRQIANFITEKGGTCIPFMSPVDVQLDRDNRTMVQPDTGILCDRSKMLHGRIFGAPDFLVEVISPSTRMKDMTLKLHKYQNAGVREYWMVDLFKRRILTYFFAGEDFPVIYTIGEKIPVLIYEGELVVDTAPLLKWIEEIEALENDPNRKHPFDLE